MEQDRTTEQRLDELQIGVDALARGLKLMLETLGTHTEMLGKILEACTVETGKSDLAEVLEELTTAVHSQTETLDGIGETLEGLGSSIEVSVMRGVHRAVGVASEEQD